MDGVGFGGCFTGGEKVLDTMINEKGVFHANPKRSISFLNSKAPINIKEEVLVYYLFRRYGSHSRELSKWGSIFWRVVF